MVFAMRNEAFEKYIGIPFEYKGRGPDAYDCYGLLRKLYQEHRGILIPDYNSETEVERIAMQFSAGIEDWVEVEKREGVAVLMRVSGLGAHVGYVIGDGKFIHTWERTGGVAIERLDTWKNLIIGYYDYAGNH